MKTIVTGGRVVSLDSPAGEPRDIVIEGDTIADSNIGTPRDNEIASHST